MMAVLVPLADALGLVAFSAALIVALSLPVSEDTLISPAGKTCMVAALSVYSFGMFSNVLEHAGITSALDPIEDNAEVLFPVLVLYTLYATHVRQRELELRAAQRAALRAQEMVLGIIDAAPAGIVVLDGAGKVTFANETAKMVLDLSEGEAGGFVHPDWSVVVGPGPPAPDFRGLVACAGGHPVPVSVVWPRGWRVELEIGTEPLVDATGATGGVVATFVPPEGMRGHGAARSR